MTTIADRLAWVTAMFTAAAAAIGLPTSVHRDVQPAIAAQRTEGDTRAARAARRPSSGSAG